MRPVIFNVSLPMNVRLFVSSIAWLLSLPGMAFHMLIATSALGGIFALPNAGSSTPQADIWIALTFPLSVLAWPAFAWMNIEWINNKPAHFALPIIGSTLALAWLISFPQGVMFLAFVAPGALLATYLVTWHVWRWRQAKNSNMDSPSRVRN